MRTPPSLSTDQVAAFVELARWGSLRGAAETLLITEQGVRNRLISLERRLGVELYRKSRGPRRAAPLTPQGREFLPHAEAFLERSAELCELFAGAPLLREVHVAASQYLIAYVLIDAVRRFHAAHPHIRVRLSAHTEREIEDALLASTAVSLGVAAPYESSPDLDYTHLFSMPWSLITPARHKLLRRERVNLAEIAEWPLIAYERGSTGRQHVIDAMQRQGLTPRIEMEATNTDLIVRMVAAGLGVGIVPLYPSGAVTRGHRLGIRNLGEQIRPIDSGILTRKGEHLPAATRQFIEFVRGS